MSENEWPPDPLLDEVDEMRRRIMAENGNDWRKVLRWHVEQDRGYTRRSVEGRPVYSDSKTDTPPYRLEDEHEEEGD
jgi:hypothetical protein